MEKGPSAIQAIHDCRLENIQIGTVGNLLKLTKDLEFDPNTTIVFYLQDRKGALHSARKNFLTIPQINEFLEKLSPHEELPENLFVYISQGL